MLQSIPHPIHVKALEIPTIFVEFSDGVQGEIDLNIQNAGIFKPLYNQSFFEKAYIGHHGSCIARNDDLEFDAINMYFTLIGKNLFTGEITHANH